MKISLIAAVDNQFAIGKNNQLLCHLPADLKMFRELTTGRTVIMGRRTFESLPNGALPKRKNIVISRTFSTPENADFIVCSSLQEALDFCSQEEEVFIIGGAQLYEQSINKADFLYITHIHSSFQGADVFFPSINSDEWVLNSKKDLFADEKNLYDYSFLIYARK